MKKAVVLFILLLAAVYLGLWMHQDPGYILITFQNWSVETTLWVLIIGIIISFIIFNFVTAILNTIIGFPGFIADWLKNRKVKKARKQTRIGLYAWIEGKWAQSERLLAKSAEKSDMVLVNYLIAARAAHHQGNFVNRDSYLNRAREISANKQTAIDLLWAQLLLDGRQFNNAIAILTHVQKQSPKSAYALQLLYRAYLELKDWHRLQLLFPSLYKYKVLPKLQLLELEKKIYINLLHSKQGNFVALHNFWSCIPRYFRHDNEILLAYVDGLMYSGNQEILIEKLLRYALKKSWDERLIEKYGMIMGSKPIKQLAFAEGFLNAHRNSSALLLCLGRLCKGLRLWGKAQNYFEICVRLQESPIVFNELGLLMEMLNRKDAALEYYRKVCSAHS